MARKSRDETREASDETATVVETAAAETTAAIEQPPSTHEHGPTTSTETSPGRFTIVDRASGKTVSYTDSPTDAYRYRCPPLCDTLRVIVTATGEDYEG